MKICYSDNFNFDLGLIGYLHPFDGTKFRKAYKALRNHKEIDFISPKNPISQEMIESYVDPLIQRYLKHKEHIVRALEVPDLPFLKLSFIERKILTPMRWGVAGTITSATEALSSEFCWNLSGGYHHASPHSIEGFCIYNDIGICYKHLIENSILGPEDNVLIIDTDAHHGNGNARTFLENPNITIVDIFNKDIYPTTYSTRNRVDISIPLDTSTKGDEYLTKYNNALHKLKGSFKLAFVVAGTDVLKTDKLGGLELSIEDIVKREIITFEFLKKHQIPAVMLAGGGYSKESSKAIVSSIKAVCHSMPG